MELDDLEEIRNLLHRYCFHVDDGANQEWSELFTEDGTFHVGHRLVASGHEQLRQFIAAGPPNGYHICANELIEVEGDLANVVSYVTAFSGTTLAPRLIGRYRDELRRIESGWRFVSRKLEPLQRVDSSQ